MGEITERQKKLMMWADYFDLLRKGLKEKHYPSDKEEEVEIWMEVLKTECHGDVMHLHTGQPEFCRSIEVEITDLREVEIDI